MLVRLLLCTLFSMPTVQAKTLLTAGGKERIAGHISGKVEIILQTMSFTAEQRKAMLEVEYRNVMSLGLDKTEPALVAKIEAYLGLARAQKERLRDLAETQKAHGKSQDSFIEYAKKVIAGATLYSDAVDVPGLPAISQQREVSMIERAHAATAHEELRDAYKHIITVHQKVSEGLKKSNTLKALVQSFIVHMKKKYHARDKGMQEEILFRAFDVLADATPDDSRTISDVVGDFITKFNRYVPAAHQMKENDLAISYIAWPEVILESRRANSHIMFLLSYAMEQVKRHVKDDAVFTQQQEMLIEKTEEAVDALREAKVSFSESKRQQPLYVATQCGAHVESLINAAGGREKLLPAQREAARRFTQLASEINQLITDYEIVARRQADNQATRRTTEERAQLSAEQRASLQPNNDNPLGGSLAGVRLIEGPEGLETQPEAQKRSQLVKWLPPIIAGVILIGWQVMGSMAQKKKEEAEKNDEELSGVWGLFERFGTPSGLVGSGIESIKKRFLKQKDTPKDTTDDDAESAETPAVDKTEKMKALEVTKKPVMSEFLDGKPKVKPETAEAGVGTPSEAGNLPGTTDTGTDPLVVDTAVGQADVDDSELPPAPAEDGVETDTGTPGDDAVPPPPPSPEAPQADA